MLGSVQDFIAKHGTNIDEDPGWPGMESSMYLLKPIGKEKRKTLLAKKRESASTSSPPKGESQSAIGVQSKANKGVKPAKGVKSKAKKPAKGVQSRDSKKAIQASGSSLQNLEAKDEAEDEKKQANLGRILVGFLFCFFAISRLEIKH